MQGLWWVGRLELTIRLIETQNELLEQKASCQKIAPPPPVGVAGSAQAPGLSGPELPIKYKISDHEEAFTGK